MSDEPAFVQAILTSSTYDPGLRLIYADWLEEHGDPRAELIRLDVELGSGSVSRPRSDELRKRFEELRPVASLVWQALVLMQSIYMEPRRPPPPGAGSGSDTCPNRICGRGNPVQLRHCAACQYPLPLESGSVVAGRYRIRQQLRLDGFGYVYRGFDLQNQNDVLVKELTAANGQDYSCLVPFFREEASLLTSLRALPLVRRVIDFHEEGQAAYLVLEHLGDASIGAMVNDGRRFPFDWVVQSGIRLAELLQYLHSQDPLLLCDHLTVDDLYLVNGQVKLQLNLRCPARWVESILVRLHERLAGIGAKWVCGLGSIEPPERIIGRPEPRSDLFCLAGILYSLLTGRQHESTFTQRMLQRDLPAMADEERWLYELIAINLAEDVGDRYYSARELRTDLERRALTRLTRCPRCGGVNPVREPFCSACSAPLTDWAPRPCRCGQRYRMGVRACRSCGERVWG